MPRLPLVYSLVLERLLNFAALLGTYSIRRGLSFRFRECHPRDLRPRQVSAHPMDSDARFENCALFFNEGHLISTVVPSGPMDLTDIPLAGPFSPASFSPRVILLAICSPSHNPVVTWASGSIVSLETLGLGKRGRVRRVELRASTLYLLVGFSPIISILSFYVYVTRRLIYAGPCDRFGG